MMDLQSPAFLLPSILKSQDGHPTYLTFGSILTYIASIQGTAKLKSASSLASESTKLI